MRVVSVAFYIILVLGLLLLVMVPWHPEGLIQAGIYLIAAIGIRRGHAWSAYGLALLILVPTALIIATRLSTAGATRMTQVGAVSVTLAVLLSLPLIVLLFFAGRANQKLYGSRGWAWPWLAATVVIAGFMTFFSLYQTPTGSMENTLLIGDRIAVWKSHATPVRGELVVHVYPVNRADTFIKRVVAVPGDRIRISNKQLFVNGAAVNEPYVEHKTSYMDSYRDNFPSAANVQLYPGATAMLAANVVNGEVVVPAGRYFVLGDNRDSSLDSRYWGFIEQSDIIGIPRFIYYSAQPSQNAAGNAGGMELLRVRWSRIFHAVA